MSGTVIVAFAAAPAMAVGSVRLEIAGLERLMRRLLEVAAETGDEGVLETAQGLALMQAMGASCSMATMWAC